MLRSFKLALLTVIALWAQKNPHGVTVRQAEDAQEFREGRVSLPAGGSLLAIAGEI